MKTSTWIVLLVIVALIAFLLGRYWAALATAVKNRDKIGAAIGLAGNLETILG